MAASGDHPKPGWVTMGYVCWQTPFGQGIGMGIKASQLRPATRDEVIAALKTVHPLGWDYRPGCQELNSASFHMMMSSPNGPRGWTADRARPGARPRLPLTRRQIETFAASASTRYQWILDNWDAITRRQIEVILDQLR
jgi:hypothetical protein